MSNGRFVQMKSTAITSFEMLFSANCDSSGKSSFCRMYSVVVERKSSIAVLNSLSSASGSSSMAGDISPIKKGLLAVSLFSLQRPKPWMIAVMLFPGPGSSSIFTRRAYTPYSKRSLVSGCSTSWSCWQNTAKLAS